LSESSRLSRYGFAALFFGAAAQMSSLLEMEAECRRESLAKRIGRLATTPSPMRCNARNR
jgi:hypothetical protein